MINLDNVDYYINREISWLDFNERVLNEAEENDNPLLERLKFCSIVSSNLDEFFMIRVAVLKKQVNLKVSEYLNYSYSPLELLNLIRKRMIVFLEKLYNIFYDLNKLLKENNINIVIDYNELKQYEDILFPIFEEYIKPSLTPLSYGATHPFPTLVTGRLYLALELEPIEGNELIEKSNFSFIEIPTSIFGRFYEIKGKNIFIPIENIIRLFIDRIYNNYKIQNIQVIKVTRDSDIEIQEDGAYDLLKQLETSIKRLHRRNIVKVEYEKSNYSRILELIASHNNLSENDFYEINGILHLKDLMEIYEKINIQNLKYKTLNPIKSIDIENKNYFDIISKKDILLYHPYHSYDPVIELLNQAAEDKNVLAIKMTLYRTSSTSAIIKALIKAAENGKYVSVIDEIKARFDEKRNIEWARELEDAGAHVTYGIAGLKIHAKALLIVRKEENGIKRYIHLGTGNYNENTAKLYCDFSYFTSDDEIGEDISSLFNLLTGFSLPLNWNKITIAPTDLRKKFIDLIRREREYAKSGVNAKIIAKMNSLVDSEIIKELYQASIDGVKIKLIIRGICCLIPGIKNLSENIEVHSIIGKFLEHSRIYYFYNGGEEEYYLSSADWMPRNLDRRIEILFPIKEKDNRKIISKILNLQLSDNYNKWILRNNRIYELSKYDKKNKLDSFEEIYNYLKKLEEEKKNKNPIEFKVIKYK